MVAGERFEPVPLQSPQACSKRVHVTRASRQCDFITQAGACLEVDENVSIRDECHLAHLFKHAAANEVDSPPPGRWLHDEATVVIFVDSDCYHIGRVVHYLTVLNSVIF